MPPKLKFSEGEKVLCFHGPLIYEAKCLKSNITKEKQVKYFIHYAGWNKNWDEWVPESRVLKYNEPNVARQREVQKAHSSQPAKSNKKSSSHAANGSSSKSNRKSDTNVANAAASAANSGKEKELDAIRANTPSVDGATIGKAAVDRDQATPTIAGVQETSGASSAQPHKAGGGDKEKKTDAKVADDGPKKKRAKADVTVESEEQFLNKVERSSPLNIRVNNIDKINNENGEKLKSNANEFQVVSRNVATKLAKMKKTQQIHAEYLIHKVLTFGSLEKLNDKSDIILQDIRDQSVEKMIGEHEAIEES